MAYEGFKKLEGQLSHEKGVYDPAGLTASIGKKKYGAKNFNKHAAMGKSMRRSAAIGQMKKGPSDNDGDE